MVFVCVYCHVYLIESDSIYLDCWLKTVPSLSFYWDFSKHFVRYVTFGNHCRSPQIFIFPHLPSDFRSDLVLLGDMTKFIYGVKLGLEVQL